MTPWQRVLSILVFVIVIMLIVVLWFYTTGAALRQASRDALQQDARAWESVTDDFSGVSDRVRDAFGSFSAQQAEFHTGTQTSSTATIDPTVIENIKQQLEEHTSSTTYGEANNQ